MWETCGIPHYCHGFVNVNANEVGKIAMPRILNRQIPHMYPLGTYFSSSADRLISLR